MRAHLIIGPTVIVACGSFDPVKASDGGTVAAPGADVAFVSELPPASAGGVDDKVSIRVPDRGVAEGSVLVVWAAINAGPHTAQFHDSRGNAYTTDVTGNGDATNVVIGSAFVENALARGDTITAVFDGSFFSHRLIAAAEFRGLARDARLDRSASGRGSGTALSTPPTAETQSPNEVLIAGFAVDGLVSKAFTAGAGFQALTGVELKQVGALTLLPMFRIVESRGSFAASGELASASPVGPSAGAIATYRP